MINIENKYIEKAHLPKKRVCLVAVSKSSQEIIDRLKTLDIEALGVEPNKNLALPISEHSDILLHHLGGNNIIFYSNNTDNYNMLIDYGFKVSLAEEDIKSPYPKDISLNCFELNHCLFALEDQIDLKIIDHYKSRGYRVVNVKQGYCKCSVLIVKDKAAITADVGIYNKMLEQGIDVLLIKEGDIVLEGYEYGFIGGCGGLIDKNLLAFTGDISTHADSKKIKAFLEKHSVKYICLTDGKLIDIGGIIPLLTV